MRVPGAMQCQDVASGVETTTRNKISFNKLHHNVLRSLQRSHTSL
jgi:hypothetical protein